MVIKKFIAILICILMFGCAPTKIQYVDKIVTVEVPIINVPSIKPIEKPILPVTKLTYNSSNTDIAEAYYNSLVMEIEYSKKLEKLLEPFYKEYRNGKFTKSNK